MKIEEIIAKYKEEGKTDDEIKVELEQIKKDIEAYLGGGDVEKEKEEEVHTEVDEDEKKMHDVFGV